VAPLIASAVLLAGLGIAITYVWRFADIAYGAVIVWAYAGIAIKESPTPLVAVSAAVGAIVVLVLIATTVLGHRAPSRRQMLGVGPSAS
jgi:hypothetical protein